MCIGVYMDVYVCVCVCVCVKRQRENLLFLVLFCFNTNSQPFYHSDISAFKIGSVYQKLICVS